MIGFGNQNLRFIMLLWSTGILDYWNNSIVVSLNSVRILNFGISKISHLIKFFTIKIYLNIVRRVNWKKKCHSHKNKLFIICLKWRRLKLNEQSSLFLKKYIPVNKKTNCVTIVIHSIIINRNHLKNLSNQSPK